MREILFRGQHVDSKAWCYGYLVKQFGSTEIYLSGNTKHSWDRHRVIPETVGQYTGLNDSNGRKIFEGDVIQDGNCDYNKYVVEYSTERGGFLPFAHGDGCGCCEINTLHDSTCHTVIGNIYDNPELIGGTDK